MSLSTSHPLWTTAASSPTKTVMATVQGRLLSGRYWTEALCSYWSNSIGLCTLSPICNVVEDMLFFCSSLPEVIRLVQKHGNHVLEHRFNITHLWCYCLHRDRLKILLWWRHFMKAWKSSFRKAGTDRFWQKFPYFVVVLVLWYFGIRKSSIDCFSIINEMKW